MIYKRETFLKQIGSSFKVNPVVALLGAGQCGKTTLARMFIREQKLFSNIHYFDLEDPEDILLFEIDLLLFIGTKRICFEFKWSDAPKLTKSIITVCEILQLNSCLS